MINPRVSSRPTVIFILLVLLCGSALTQWVYAADQGRDLQAAVTKVEGKHVQISSDAGKSWHPARMKEKLGKDAQVRTGFASGCEVTFGDHSVLQVRPLSSVKIADYIGTDLQQKVRATLQYGAVRCGVEKGRVKADTAVSTPVSTLSIRGTVVYVEYDPGTRRCTLWTIRDGPALARTSEGKYELDEGMDTDCSLSRYLERASFRRRGWLDGNSKIGNITDDEKNAAYQDTTDPTDGAFQNNDDKSRDAQEYPDKLEIPGADIPIG